MSLKLSNLSPPPAPPAAAGPVHQLPLIEYYDLLEVLLAPSREAGELRTHFGIADRCPDDYCFLAACATRQGPMAQLLRSSAGRLHDRVFAPYRPAAGSRLLDVGCGAGGTLEALTRRWPDVHFDGVNLNPGQLRLAARALAGRPNVRLLAGDVLEVPADGSYDLIYCLESAFHIADKSRLLRRFAALAAPGAELCLVDVFPTRRLQRSLERQGSARSGIFSYLDVEAWTELSGRCGFRLTGWEELSRQVANSIVIRTPLADFLGRMETALAQRSNAEALLRRAREVYLGYRKLHRMLSRGFAHYGILRTRRLTR